MSEDESTPQLNTIPEGYLLYTRKSTDDAENQKNSIEYQIAEGKRYARSQGLLIVNTTIEGFCDEGIIKEHHSGYKADTAFQILADGSIKQKVERPKFFMLVDLLQRKQFKGVICLCWDRISRNEGDDVLIKKLIHQGIDIRFSQTQYDQSSSGALHMDIDGMFSRHYSRVISEKVKNTASKLRADGKCIYLAPIGYLNEGSSKKSLDSERAPIIKQLFELYATGKWSYTTLAYWAKERGLTTRPFRRKRTKEERLSGVSLADLPKVSRPISAKSIEHILTNPFYIGKIVYKGTWFDSKAHQPLIDTGLFLKVKSIQAQKKTTIRYPELSFYLYRGLVRCASCKRVYSPYLKKGHTYYTCRCAKGCLNSQRTVSEASITKKIKELFSTAFFSNEELRQLDVLAERDFERAYQLRNTEGQEIYRKLHKLGEDLDYLKTEKLSLLRTGAMTAEDIISEEARLIEEINNYKDTLSNSNASFQDMIAVVVKHSELIKHISMYFDHILDNEKRAIVASVFTELFFEPNKLKYVENKCYSSFFSNRLTKIWQSGGVDYVNLELPKISALAKQETKKLEEIIFNLKSPP
jgi:site-specific DNA recombinase